MCDALLRADGDDGLRLRIEVHRISALIPGTNSTPQPGHATRERVAMRRRLLRGFDELVDDVPRRRAVGVPHAEVDDVFAALPRRRLQFAGDVEHIRGQPRQSLELFHASPPEVYFAVNSICTGSFFGG